MLAARRVAAAPVRQLLRRQPRRFDSHSSHGSESHAAEHHGPVNEGFGKGFYITVAAVPVLAALYQFSRSDPQKLPIISRLIEAYSEKEEEYARRNALHTTMSEQAAADRHLFQTAPRHENRELTNPEIFNGGSPWNVVAGQQGGDLSKLVAFYEKKNRDAEAARIDRMKDGKVVSVYDS